MINSSRPSASVFPPPHLIITRNAHSAEEGEGLGTRLPVRTGNRTGAPVQAPFSPRCRPVLLERTPVERPVYGKFFLTRTVYTPNFEMTRFMALNLCPTHLDSLARTGLTPASSALKHSFRSVIISSSSQHFLGDF